MNESVLFFYYIKKFVLFTIEMKKSVFLESLEQNISW